jgi:hypothetical protein
MGEGRPLSDQMMGSRPLSVGVRETARPSAGGGPSELRRVCRSSLPHPALRAPFPLQGRRTFRMAPPGSAASSKTLAADATCAPRWLGSFGAAPHITSNAIRFPRSVCDRRNLGSFDVFEMYFANRRRSRRPTSPMTVPSAAGRVDARFTLMGLRPDGMSECSEPNPGCQGAQASISHMVRVGMGLIPGFRIFSRIDRATVVSRPGRDAEGLAEPLVFLLGDLGALGRFYGAGPGFGVGLRVVRA